MVLLDINNTAGESFKEALDKEYGRENTLFLKCDVESEGQIKGMHAANHRSAIIKTFITVKESSAYGI